MLLMPIIEIFCDIDDFCKGFEDGKSAHILPNPDRKRNRKCMLSASEIMTILILFHMSHYRTFKDFYTQAILTELKIFFPSLPSYSRFVEIESSVLAPLTSYLISKMGDKTNLYYMDSTSLAVCHNKRIARHKTFKNIAKRGKTTMGWFFGFKLHIAVNNKGELISFCITKGNVNDTKVVENLTKNLQGIVAADKGYLSKSLSEKLEQHGLKLVTRVRKNMKKKMFSAFEKFFLSQRGIIETIIQQLKYICQIDHSRHRNPDNFIMNILSGLVAYALKPRKPSAKLNIFAPQALLLTSN